jgi:hypothetical protein
MSDSSSLFTNLTADCQNGSSESVQDLPERIRFNIGEERLVRVTRSGAVNVFVHDQRYNQMPGLDFSVQCQRDCPLCAIGRVPVLVTLLPAIDLATLATGYLRLTIDLKRRDGSDLKQSPAERHQITIQNTKFGTQVAKLCLFSNSPEVVTLRILKPTEMKFVVLEAKIAPELEPEATVMPEAIETLTRSAEALKENEAVAITPDFLNSVPALNRALQLKGLA